MVFCLNNLNNVFDMHIYNLIGESINQKDVNKINLILL